VIRATITVTCLIILFILPVAGDEFPPVYDSETDTDAQPMSAAEAAESMIVPAGFRVSLFAAEPMVRNPIAMAWDDSGRMWVAENYTYAERPQRFDLSLRDRVVVLEDLDNDGKAESSRIFTDNVQMLTSVEVGRGGVWLMCPPQLLFIPDTDQDCIPDGPTQVILDGFDVARDNYHNFANGLRWGPDGWLYGRCGHSCPGMIGAPGTPQELRVPIQGGIWRYHPQRKTVEVICHGTTNPWGHDWDRNGELFFINTVIGHVWHAIPGAHFRESYGESRNPFVYERMDMIGDHYHFETIRTRSLEEKRTADRLGGGHAHIGMTICQSEAWPERYHDRLFTLNMHGRRANMDRLDREAAGFVARHEPDFLKAADPFFRGLEINFGPDGNMFVLDWSDTGECHEYSGVHRNSGRVFKISYGSQRAPSQFAKPQCLSGTGQLPELWRKHQAGDVKNAELLTLLHDPDEHARVWAIRLLTDFWPLDTIVGPRVDAVYSDDAATRMEFLRMAKDDESGLVHLALASVLQRLPVNRRAELATALVTNERFANDRDLPLLVWYGLIPLAEQDPQALASIARQCRWPVTLKWMTRFLASQIETRPAPVGQLVTSAIDMSLPLQNSVLDGLFDAFYGWRTAPRPGGWSEFARTKAAQDRTAEVLRLNALFGDGLALQQIRDIVFDDQATLDLRQTALETLINNRPDDLRQVCETLLRVRTLNATAAKGLALFDDADIGGLLAAHYRRFHPRDRPALLELLVSRPAFAIALLESVGDKNGPIPLADISASHARQVQSLQDDACQQKLLEVWGEVRESGADRLKQIASLKAQLNSATVALADLSEGRQLFKKTCSACHVLYGEGKRVGPDLTGSQRSNPNFLLSNVVDPSAVVGAEYRMTIVATNDGRVLNGLIVERYDNTILLQTATDVQSLRVDDIDELRPTALSSMPDGLLNTLSSDQVTKLLSYVMHPHQVPLPTSSVPPQHTEVPDTEHPQNDEPPPQ
jgi:putative membrane-bound dehydrogenase-like protein